MNINKLIEQSTTTEEYGWGASYEQFDKEKFAKLIVLKCAAIAETTEPYKTSDCIKKHFGVEDMFDDNDDDTDAGGDMFIDFFKVVLAIFGFVLFAAALGGIVWWSLI
jgi:hypothetical protein